MGIRKIKSKLNTDELHENGTTEPDRQHGRKEVATNVQPPHDPQDGPDVIRGTCEQSQATAHGKQNPQGVKEEASSIRIWLCRKQAAPRQPARQEPEEMNSDHPTYGTNALESLT